MQDLATMFPYIATYCAEQINVVPPQYGMVTKTLNLFPREGTTSRNVEMWYENYQIQVLPAKGIGAPASLMEERTGKAIIMTVPYFPHLDLIRPTDIQDILQVYGGGQKQVNTLSAELDKRLMNIRWNHDITWEWLCTQALQGLLVDGNGTTLYDLYATFGVTKTTVDFDLGTATTDISGKCQQVYQTVSQNITQDVMTGVEAIVDPTFFQKLVSHANVKQFYVNAEQAVLLLNMDRMRGTRDSQHWGRSIELFNILWREYYGQATLKNGSTRPFWQPNTGTAFPSGTLNMFKTWDAPANDIRYVNTRGQPIYVSPRVLEHGQGLELLSQSNTLPVVRRPQATVQITSST